MSRETESIGLGTEERRLEDEGGRRERVYRLMFEHATDPIVIIDDQGRVLDENHAMRELYAEELGELLPARMGAWAIRNVDVKSFQEELVRTGRATADAKVTGRAGRSRWFSIEAKTHAPSRHVLVLREVTEERSLTERLNQLRRVESLGYATASVVHDLGNLLTVIAGANGRLVAQLPQGEALSTATEVGAAADRASGLLRQILSFVKRKGPGVELLSIDDVLAELAPILRRIVGPDVAVEIRRGADVARVSVNREQLEQAVLNLCTNARDAMSGRGVLTLETASVELDEDACPGSSSGAYVSLQVTDTGAGMSPEAQASAFQDFYTTKVHGTGLGLASVRRFVDQCGGGVALRSAVGEGTTIRLCLPVSPSRP